MSEQEKRLEGLVAQIINSRELAINIGAEHGVTPNMKFAILSAAPIEIRDPETKELLDTIDREKVRVEVATIRPKITVCRTYKTKFVGGLQYNDIIRAFNPLTEPRQEVVETLKADSSEYPAPLSEADSYVKIGDRVRQVF